MLWLYRDTKDVGEVADLSWAILWVVVPSVSILRSVARGAAERNHILGVHAARVRSDGACVLSLSSGSWLRGGLA